MSLYEDILEALKKEYADGATYQEMAEKYGVSYTHIHNLLHGKRSIDGISLRFFFRLFPKATVNIGGGIVAPVVNNGSNLGTMTGVVTGIECAVDKILQTDDLTDAEKIKVLKVLKK